MILYLTYSPQFFVPLSDLLKDYGLENELTPEFRWGLPNLLYLDNKKVITINTHSRLLNNVKNDSEVNANWHSVIDEDSFILFSKTLKKY